MENQNRPAISVIIPMFNAENYVAECLTSLANQTFQNFEIVIVDDCSTDNSIEVVKNFFPIFGDRLRLMRLSKNSGCAAIPRNFALKAAEGKYVYFLDSDDFVADTALEELYTSAEKFDADVVHTEKYFELIDKNPKDSAKRRSFQTGELVTEPTLETFDLVERVTGFIRVKFRWQIGGNIFRRQFLIDNKIAFSTTKIFEDFVFMFKCVVAAKNYVRVPFVSYYYRIRENSASHRIVDSVQFVSDVVGVVASVDDFMRGRKFFADNPQYTYAVIDFFVQERLKVFSNDIFLKRNHTSAEVYDVLCKYVFSQNPQDNVALTSYLFITANIFRLYMNQQAAEIAELKRQLKVQS